MDVDSIVHSYIQAMVKKQVGKKDQKPQKKPQATAPSTSKTKPLSAVRPSNKTLFDPGLKQGKQFFCFNCDAPGHYARDCKQPSSSNPHKIRQLAQLLDGVLELQDNSDDDTEEEEEPISQNGDDESEEEETNEDEPLIDMGGEDF